jgi:hypothetical protein
MARRRAAAKQAAGPEIIEFPPPGDGEALPAQEPEPEIDAQELVASLGAYILEAETARKTGPNARDDVWERNWDAYWRRTDRGEKAKWQSNVELPDAPVAVDRWAAALKRAFEVGEKFYEVVDVGDPDGDLKWHVERYMDYLLANCGRSAQGHYLPFASVLERALKAGAVTMPAMAVTWDTSGKYPCVMVEAVDARSLWLDATGRNLYRIVRSEIDKHELLARAQLMDAAGQPIYNVSEIEQLTAYSSDQKAADNERSSGHTDGGQVSGRQPVTLHEFLVKSILRPNGEVMAGESLVVMANERFIIRGPEPNPYAHGEDWVVASPMIDVPFSVYGRSYMENWVSIAEAMTELTNLIIDGVRMTVMKAYAAVPDLLEDPSELSEGIWPNKVFQLTEGSIGKDFIAEINFGELPEDGYRLLQGLSKLLREGTQLNELSLGQLAQRGNPTATEVDETKEGSSAAIESMASTIERSILEPVFNLMFLTGLQHEDFTNPRIIKAIGEDTARMFERRRQEFIEYGYGFKVRGITEMIARGKKLRSLVGLLQTIGQIEPLMMTFLKKYDIGLLLDEMMRLMGVDPLQFTPTVRQKQMAAAAAALSPQPLAVAPGSAGKPSPPAARGGILQEIG